MKARSEASEATTRRILDAAFKLFGESLFDQVSLHDVATQAGVGVQTVLRHFASKELLFAAATEWASPQIRAARQATAGDVAGVVRALVDTYERWGDEVLNFLAQEQRSALMRATTDRGRNYHHFVVEQSFAPQLARLPLFERTRRLAQLIAVTDLYVWKVMRRDLGLSRDQTEDALRDLVIRLVEISV